MFNIIIKIIRNEHFYNEYVGFFTYGFVIL